MSEASAEMHPHFTEWHLLFHGNAVIQVVSTMGKIGQHLINIRAMSLKPTLNPDHNSVQIPNPIALPRHWWGRKAMLINIVVLVHNANTFKGALNKFWCDKILHKVYDCTADLTAARNRSRVLYWDCKHSRNFLCICHNMQIWLVTVSAGHKTIYNA